MTYIETDVHASADQIAVLCHDAFLWSAAGTAHRVDELNLAQLQGVNLGGGHTVARLQQALEAFPHCRFNIDIKSDDAVIPTVRCILAAGAIDRVLVTSFNDRRRRKALMLLPGVATSASAGTSLFACVAATFGQVALCRRILRNVDAVQLPERYRMLRVLTHRTVRVFRASDVEVHAWTVNDPTDMDRLLDLGVDGLITDRPDLGMQVLRKRPRSRE